MLMRSKSTPRSSPRAERSHSQRQLARSEPGHAGDDAGHGERALRAVEAQPLQQRLPDRARSMAHSPTCSTPDRARADQLQGADIHRLQVGTPDPAGRGAVEQLRDDALGMALDLFRTAQRNQLGLAVEKLPHPAAQHRPVPPLDREVAAEVEQGALADLLAVALRAHQTMRIIDLAALAGAGSGAPDEQGAQHRSGRKRL